MSLLPYKKNIDLSVNDRLFIDLSNQELEADSFVPEFLQKITPFKPTTLKLTLCKKLSLMKTKKKSYHLSADPLVLRHIVNPALVIALHS